MNRRGLRVTPTRITLALVCLALGIMAAAQWRTQASLSQLPVLPSNTDQVVITRNLVENNARLRAEISELETKLGALQASNPQDTLQVLVDELNRLRIVNGLVQVSGPGIRITIAGDISVYEVQDIINELRNAGAEAISLNDQRLIASSHIQAHGTLISVNGTSASSPYAYEAIGDPETLQQACERRGGIFDLIETNNSAIQIQITSRQKLVLPVYREAIIFNYAVIAP